MTRSPFLLQELVEEISSYLDRSDVARCARVCKAWHEALVPLLFRHIRYDNQSQDIASLWAGVQRHSSYMRSFTVTASYFPDPALLGPECRNLTEISLGPLDFVDQPALSHARMRIVTDRNPFIHTLRIDLRRHLSGILFRGNNFLQQMPALRNLAILDDRYPYSQGPRTNGAFEAILGCGPQLETLTYQVFWGSSSKSESSALEPGQEECCTDVQPWTRLSSLTICGFDGWREVELVKRSPNLRRLSALFKQLNCDKVLRQMAQHYRSGHPSRLEHLEVSHLRGQQAQAGLQELLEASAETSKLKTVCFYVATLIPTTARTLLRHHGAWLEKLVMVNSNWVHNFDLSRLVTSCPRLKHLETSVGSSSRRWIQNLVRSPWVCTGLRVFHLTICQEITSLYRSESSECETESEMAMVVATKRSNDGEECAASPERQFWRQIAVFKDLGSLRINVEPRLPVVPLSVEDEDVDQLCALTRLWELRMPSAQDFIADAVKDNLRQRRPGLSIVFG
ncbi:hypothetical protein BGX31_010127 [Mortierella sp. GBA43]|nr:hypothetical protein BGX31_010127 [Mortierella sp. GBA43]